MEIIESIALTTLCISTILCHMVYWRESLAYPFYLQVCMLISISLLLFTIIGIRLELIERYRRFGGKLWIYAGLTYAIFNPFMLAVFILLGSSYQSTAAENNILIIDGIYVLMSNMITIVLLMLLFGNCVDNREEKNNEKVVLKEIEEFYRVIKSNPHATLMNLAHKSKFINIGKFSFTSDDSKHLNLYCGHDYMINQDDIPKDERQDCSICLGVLEKGERVIGHPGCNHTFHKVCLLYWLSHGSKVGRCPTCKSNTRSELFASMMSNKTDSVSHALAPEIK